MSVGILALPSVPFKPTMEQMPNLALIEPKRIPAHTVIRFVSIVLNLAFLHWRGFKWDSLDIKLKYAIGTLECAYFSFNKCPI